MKILWLSHYHFEDRLSHWLCINFVARFELLLHCNLLSKLDDAVDGMPLLTRACQC